MVDFRKLREKKAKPAPINPREIFNRLPRPEGINDLYVSQDEVLHQWYDRRNERDLILKLHTGGGKTLVGLLIAQSIMNEHRQPVLYLTPTVQLVGQILEKAAEYSIPGLPYTKGEPLPEAFHEGSAVLVATYEALFNGRTKKFRGDNTVECAAIILDDGHAAVASIRAAFSMHVDRNEHEEVYLELANIFRPSFKETGRAGTFEEIISGQDTGVLEVPFWAWQERTGQVLDFLRPHADALAFFSWPFLRDELAYCHCIFSRSAATITPLLPSVDLVPTFEQCPRRIFMSATIADDSELVRNFGVSAAAAKKPITSVSLAGVSERMILVPGLMGLDRGTEQKTVKWLATQTAAKTKFGVVILTPSGPAAGQWTDIAEYPNTSESVAGAVGRLQTGATKGPVVLANRYDGIDLPKDACRFLVVSGLPRIMSDYDVFRSDAMENSAHSAIVAQRIEQGMGRAARGSGDWCVVVLLGRDLVAWIGKKDNLRHLTSSTRLQLEMGREVSKTVTSAKEMGQTVNKAYSRDKEWMSYHADELANAAVPTAPAAHALDNADAERQTYRLWKLGQFKKALATLDKRIDSLTTPAANRQRAWLSSVAARVANASGDSPGAQTYLHSAYAENSQLTRPLAAPAYVALPMPGAQANAISTGLKDYGLRRAILAEFDENTSALTHEVSSNMFEEALKNLGNFLGFSAQRPEKIFHIGPDVLWLSDAKFGFVIEAKSGKESRNPLYKRDHAQLLEAEKWFHSNYKGWRCVRVSVLDQPVADSKASTEETKALTMAKLSALVTEIRLVLEALLLTDIKGYEIEQLCEKELRTRGLNVEGIIKKYLTDFTVAPAPTKKKG